MEPDCDKTAFGVAHFIPGVPNIGIGGVVLVHPRLRLVDRFAIDSKPLANVPKSLLQKKYPS